MLSGTNGPPGALEATTRAIARLQRQVLGPRAPGTWLKEIVFGRYNRRFAPNRTGFDWLSRDPAEVDKYRDDPLCGFALTTQAWVDFLEGKSTLGSASQLQGVPKALPIHVIAGTRDPVGEDGKGVERLLARPHAAGTDPRHAPVLRRGAPRAGERDEPRRGDARRDRVDRSDSRRAHG